MLLRAACFVFFFFWNRYIKKEKKTGRVCVCWYVGGCGNKGEDGMVVDLWTDGWTGWTGWTWNLFVGVSLCVDVCGCRCRCVGVHVGRFILTLTLVLTYVLYTYLLYLTLLCSLINDLWSFVE